MPAQATQQEKDLERMERVLAEDTRTGSDYTQLRHSIRQISNWYDNTKSRVCFETTSLYHLFSYECHYQAERMANKYKVSILLVDGQPYETLYEMSEDIRQGVLKISTDNALHPLMDLDETISLRIWHDLTHYEIQTNFGFLGEYNTYLRQVEHCQEYSSHKDQLALRHVLFCDIVGQVANGLTHRRFPIQKVFTLEEGLC